MGPALPDNIHKINYLSSELDALYHQASHKLGMTDSDMRVLYALNDNGDRCLLADIYKQSGIRKQTVNSAIRKLEKNGILYLGPHKGKTKMVYLTEAGKQYAADTVVRLRDAETRAFAGWTEEEINTHIRLIAKYVDAFRAEIPTI